MNLLYCGDENIADGLFISILSLLKNIKENLKIYVLTINLKDENYNIKGISDYTINFLDRKVKEVSNNNFVKRIDITEIFKKEVPNINMETRFTPCCMLRLFADEIEEIPDKILYFDNDVVVRKDFTQDFYNLDINDYEMVGILDYYGKWFFKNNFLKFDYLNSGVLLLNVEKIRKTGLFKKARKMCQEKKMFMPDQSALNKLCKYKKIMPRKYNEQRKLKKDTIIQHFTTSFRFFPWIRTVTIKPWQIDKMHNDLKNFEYDDILSQYVKEKENLYKIMEEI